MKNPANPGVSSTNGTRGVVLSGMSETTKRTLGADMIDLSVPWARRIDRTHRAARPVDQQTLRALRFPAEGGTAPETTNFTRGNWSELYGAEKRPSAMVPLGNSFCWRAPLGSRFGLHVRPAGIRYMRILWVPDRQIVDHGAATRFWWGHSLMCHECVIIEKTGAKLYADCCQQLADNLGCAVVDLPMDEPRDHGLDPNECLCWIDFAKIAADRGMAWRGPSYATDDPHWDDHVLTEIDASGGEGV